MNGERELLDRLDEVVQAWEDAEAAVRRAIRSVELLHRHITRPTVALRGEDAAIRPGNAASDAVSQAAIAWARISEDARRPGEEETR